MYVEVQNTHWLYLLISIATPHEERLHSSFQDAEHSGPVYLDVQPLVLRSIEFLAGCYHSSQPLSLYHFGKNLGFKH